MSRPAPRARRWPDLMIGVLIALLLVGFGLLLFRPDTRTSAAPAAATTATTPSIPSAPASTDPAAPAPAPATAVTPTPTEPPTIAAAPVEPTQPITTTPAPTAVPTADTPDATPPAATSAPRAGGAVAASEQRVPLRSDYRITLGTFSTPQAAATAAAPVSALGYTVYPIDLGAQVVAQIGPFADETTARRALADIQRAYPRAVLYPPRNRSLTQAASSDATAAAPTTPAPAAAPSGPVYLQVGAFDRVESAQKLVQQLRDLGYAPTVNAPDGKKVTVLVGPYTGDAVTRTERRLDTSGVDHFRVR